MQRRRPRLSLYPALGLDLEPKQVWIVDVEKEPWSKLLRRLDGPLTIGVSKITTTYVKVDALRHTSECSTLSAPPEPGRDQSTAVKTALLGAMAIWGLNVSVVKLLTTWFDPMALATWRMTVAVTAMTAILGLRRFPIMRLDRRQFASLLACALLMVYANQILFIEGLRRSTATNGALIIALSPLVSSLLAALAFGERLTVHRIAGVMLGFAGVGAVLFSNPGAGVSAASVGDLMLVASIVSFAGGGVIVQRLARKMDPLAISWAVFLAGTIPLWLHTSFSPGLKGAEWLSLGYWPWVLVLFSGVAATGIGNLIWNKAIATIGVARTAMYLYWVPVFGVLFAALLLGETLTLWHLCGLSAVMAGTWLGTRQAVIVPAPAP